MILTIGQYIEAFTNSEGRLRTLRKLYPVTDTKGEPLFSVPGHGLVDFDLLVDKQRMTLRCPLRKDGGAESKLHSLAQKDRGLGSKFFTEWSVLENEVMLFDQTGSAIEVDIMIRPSVEGLSPEQFLKQAVERRDVALIISSLRQLSELARWMQSVGRAEAALNRLLLDGEGAVRLTGFSARGDMCDISLAIFFAAVMPEKFADISQPILIKGTATDAVVIKLCAEAERFGFAEPAQILAGDIVAPLTRLACYSQEQIAKLGQQLSTGLELPETQSVLTENRADYDWSEDEKDGIKCVKDIDGWRYVSHDNSPLIDRTWLFASPFREGRAEVETVGGKGVVDKTGGYIVEPIYEEVAWDEYWGLIAVMSEGRWSLLDREGMMFTERHYDWLGECSEGLILAQEDGKCGFLDVEGHEVIPFIYEDATSFSQGCSFATLDGDSFYIDGRGTRL